MRLHGKRKLPPCNTTAASTHGDSGTTTTAYPTTSNRKKLTTTVDKSARHEAKGVKSGGRYGLNPGGNVGWSSLTWKAAQTLRKRMETVNMSDVSMQSLLGFSSSKQGSESTRGVHVLNDAPDKCLRPATWAPMVVLEATTAQRYLPSTACTRYIERTIYTKDFLLFVLTRSKKRVADPFWGYITWN